MSCRNCGTEINNNDKFCTNCGSKILTDYVNQPIDFGNKIYYSVGAYSPIVGLILGLVWRKKKPNSSKQLFLGCLEFISLIIACLIIIFINFWVGVIFLIGSMYFVKKMINNLNKKISDIIESSPSNIQKSYEMDNENMKNFKLGIIFSSLAVFVFIFMFIVKFMAFLSCWLISLVTAFLLSPDSCFNSVGNGEGYEGFIIVSLILLLISIVFFIKFFINKKNINSKK